MIRKVLAGIVLACLILGMVPISTATDPSPPTKFEGEAKHIFTYAIEEGYVIGVGNRDIACSLDVWFDGEYKGRISKANWDWFLVNNKVKHVIVAFESDFPAPLRCAGKAYHRYLSEEDWHEGEYYIRILENKITDRDPNKEDIQVKGTVEIPFEYYLPRLPSGSGSHYFCYVWINGNFIEQFYLIGHAPYLTGPASFAGGVETEDSIKITSHFFENGIKNVKIELRRPQVEFSDEVSVLDFQNSYVVAPIWGDRTLTKDDFDQEFEGLNVKKITYKVKAALEDNPYFKRAYIPEEHAADLELVRAGEIWMVKAVTVGWEFQEGVYNPIKIIWEIGGKYILDLQKFNPTTFLLETFVLDPAVGVFISAATDTWKSSLAGSGDVPDPLEIYDDAPSGDFEGNKYGVFTEVYAEQFKYDDNGELKGITNANTITWRFVQPFFLDKKSGEWDFAGTGTCERIVRADYIPGGANCIEWTSKPEFISPKEKNTVSFAGEIKRGVFPDYENQRDMFFVIELPDAYEILGDKKGTGFKLSEFTGVETPIELPIEDNLNDMNEEIETEYPKLYDRAGDSIFRIYVKETEDKWCVMNAGVGTDYYDFNPDTVHPRLFAVNLEKSLGKPYFFGFTLTVDKDLKEDKYDDYVIKYGVFPGKVSSTSEDYKDMISYDINSANGLNLKDSLSLKVTDEVSVSGQVIDKESGEPISNAVVGVYHHGIGQILDPSTYTDSDGKFNLRYLGEEPFTLAAWKEGYIEDKQDGNSGGFITLSLEKKVEFKIEFRSDKNTYQPGETAMLTIDVTNNRDQDTEIWLGTTFKYPTLKDQEDIPLKRAVIPKGETESFDDIEWTIPPDAPIGHYEIAVNCWKDAGQNEYYTDNIVWAPIFTVDMITPTIMPTPPEFDIDALFASISDLFEVIISTLNELVLTLQQKTINVPPEQKAKENVEDALGALAGMAEAYYGFMEMIYELSEVEPPKDAEVKFDYHVLSAMFCNNIAEAQAYMSSGGIKSADMNDALDLVRELELAKTGFCIVIVDYSFIGFGEYESGKYPIVCNEKGDPFWESWQFYEKIKGEIEGGYKEYE